MRTVIEAPNVTEAIDLEQSKYPRLEDAFDALKWWLAHVPESGTLLDDLNWICRQRGDYDQNIPTLVAIYTFDHNGVEILHILIRVPVA